MDLLPHANFVLDSIAHDFQELKKTRGDIVNTIEDFDNNKASDRDEKAENTLVLNLTDLKIEQHM